MGGELNSTVVITKGHIWVVALLISQVSQGIDKKHGFTEVFEFKRPTYQLFIRLILPSRINGFHIVFDFCWAHRSQTTLAWLALIISAYFLLHNGLSLTGFCQQLMGFLQTQLAGTQDVYEQIPFGYVSQLIK